MSGTTEQALAERQYKLAQYVAGKLPEEEAGELERAMLGDPELARDVELTARLRSGVRSLAQKGELAGYVHQQPAAPWRTYALAASLAALMLGGLAAYLKVRVSGLRDELASANAPQVLDSVHQLVVLRGTEVTEIQIKPGAWIGLSIEADQFPGREVAVELSDAQQRTVWTRQLRVSDAGGDGARIELALNGAALEPGRYQLLVRAIDSATPQSVTFVLNLLPASQENQ